MIRRIRRIFDYWRPILGMEGWNIVLRFDEKKHAAYCIGTPQYLEATLGFNPRKIRGKLKHRPVTGFDPLEEFVLHEMVHVINPRASETSVSQMTFALLRARVAAAPRP